MKAALEHERLIKIEEAAHNLLVWTHQYAINTEGGWHVSHLHPSVYNKMNEAERQLYIALGGSNESRD